jgi:hypothetical protein
MRLASEASRLVWAASPGKGEVLGQTCFEGSELLCAKRGAARLHNPRLQHPLKLTAHILE